MAETKTKKRTAAKRPGSSSKSKSPSSKAKSAKSKAAKRSAKPKSSRPKSSDSKTKAPSSSGSSNGSGGSTAPVEAVRHAVGGAGQTVGKVASKAKVPLVAGGAAIVGAAGGAAIAASKQGRKKGMKDLKAAMPRKPKVKIKSGDLAKAAKEVGNFSTQMGELASELQRAREAADANGRKHRSPVEVVLQGLTARR